MASLIEQFIQGKQLGIEGGLLNRIQSPLALIMAQNQAQLPSPDMVQAPEPLAPPISPSLPVPGMTPTGPAGAGAGGGGLGAVFAGQDDPNLSPEENAAIKRQAIINAGLVSLMSQAPGLGGVAEGALAGQRFAAGERDFALQRAEQARAQLSEQEVQRRRDEVGRLLSDGATFESVDDAIGEIIAVDPEMAKSLVSLRSQLETPDTDPPKFSPVEDSQGNVIGSMNEQSGEFFGVGGERLDELPRAARVVTPNFDLVEGEDADGNPAFFRINVDSGTIAPVEGVRPPGKPPTAAQLQAASSARSVGAELAIVRETVDAARSLKVPINALTGTDRQRFDTAAGSLAAIALKLQSGATATEQEFGRVIAANIPRFGDAEETINEKLGRMDRMMKSFEAQAGKEALNRVDAVLGSSGGGANMISDFFADPDDG